MKTLVNNKYERIFLVIAIASFLFASMPGLFVIPIDKIQHLITGVNYDITIGMIAFFFTVPLLSLTSIVFTIYTVFKYKKITNLIILLTLLIIGQAIFLYRYSGL